MVVERTDEGGACLLKLSGTLNEGFDPRTLEPLPDDVIVDVGGIARITSSGVRVWCDFVRAAGQRRFYLLSCPQVFIDQLNLVLNFSGASEVVTARVRCVCEG